jgi:NTE family protein
VDNVPVVPAIAIGAHFIIAVDASVDPLSLGSLPTSAIESLFRCNELSRITLNMHRRTCADVLLIPQIGQLYWANFAAMEPCRVAGRIALEESLELIQKQKHQRRRQTLWGKRHPARSSNWQHPFAMY